MPSQADCRDAIHWFVDNVGLYSGSVRSLFATDFAEELEPVLESAIINLKARGVNQLVLSGDALYKQAEFLWQQALRNTTFGRPVASKFELEMTGADVLIIKYLEAPEVAPQLWYLYHHVLYPRALYGRPTLFTTPLGYEEFLAYGASCDDMEYAGRKVTWEKFLWLLDASTLDLNHLRMTREEGLPPMLKAEYYLYKTMSGRGLNPLPQHVLDDYMLDFALVEKDRKVDIECDVIASLDGSAHAAEAKRNLVLLNDGWKVVRFSTAEILSNVVACADAVEEVWQQGRKKSNSGRLLSGQASVRIPELPVDDEVQRFAITHGGGPAALTGGAGTGKSSCIIHRVAYLLAQGINPESILVVSHSAESTKSLKHALENVTERQFAQKVNFFSWHDLGLKILKENLPAIKRKPPLKTEANNQKVIQRLLTKYKKELDPAILELSEELDEFTLGSLISLYKANLVAPKNVKERAKGDIDELVAKVYQAYEDQLQKTNRVDRDDMVSLAALVLVEQPDVRARYQYQFEYVLVDEYQDVTAAGDLLARLLAFPQDNIFVAGDEDESIYESKGALPKLLADISIRLPNARCYVLEKNWRSHPAIVDHARQFASGLARRRIEKDMISGWGAAPTTAIIGPHMLDNDVAESDWVAEEVHILIDSGRNPEDIAILYRSSRYAVLIEEALHRKGIRCLATHPEAALVPDEIGDVMAFLRLVMDPDGPKARESFERICQLRVKEVDPKLSPTIASFAEANSLSYLKAVEIYSEAVAEQSCRDLEQLVRIIRTMNQENLPPAETIALLRRTQRLNDFYRGIKVPPGVNYEPLRKLGQLEEEARKYKTVSEFVKAQTSLKQTGKGGVDSAVHILTLHEVKGLEFPVIFMVGMAEGIFPQDSASDAEEERRLFYVGISRGRELLYISYPGAIDEKLVMPSPLLVEARLMAAPPPVHPAVAQQAAQAAAAAKAAAAKAPVPAQAAAPAAQIAASPPAPAPTQTPLQTGQHQVQKPAQQVPMQTGQYPAQQPAQQAPMQTGQYPAQQPAQQAPMQTGQYPAQQAPMQTGQYPPQQPAQQAPMQTGQYPAQPIPAQQTPVQPAARASEEPALSEEVRRAGAINGLSEADLQIARKAVEAQLGGGGGTGSRSPGAPRGLKKGQPGEHDAFLAAMGGPRRGAREQSNPSDSGKANAPPAAPADGDVADDKQAGRLDVAPEESAGKTKEAKERVDLAGDEKSSGELSGRDEDEAPVEPMAARRRGRPPKGSSGPIEAEKQAEAPAAAPEKSEPPARQELAVDPVVAELFDDLLPSSRSQKAESKERHREKTEKADSFAEPVEMTGSETGRESESDKASGCEEVLSSSRVSGETSEQQLVPAGDSNFDIAAQIPPEKTHMDAFDTTFEAAEAQAGKSRSISWDNVSVTRKPQQTPELQPFDSPLQPHNNLSKPELEDWEQILEDAARPESSNRTEVGGTDSPGRSGSSAKPVSRKSSSNAQFELQADDLPKNYRSLKEEMARQKRDAEPPESHVMHPPEPLHEEVAPLSQEQVSEEMPEQPGALVDEVQAPPEQRQQVLPQQQLSPPPSYLPPHEQYMPPPAALQPQNTTPSHYSAPHAQRAFDEDGGTIPHCPQCFVVLEVGARFCGDCGYGLGVRIPACRQCQAPLEPGAKFCGECGERNPAGTEASATAGAKGAIDAQQAETDEAMQNFSAGEGTKPQPKGKKIVNKIIKFLEP